MQFTINLTTRTWINRHKLNTALTVAILALLFPAFVDTAIVIHNSREISRLRGMQQEMDAKLGKTGQVFSPAEYQNLLAEIRQVNGIIVRKTSNWTGILDHLETVVPEGVALSAIEPSTKDQTLKIAGEALNFKGLRRLVENLEDSPFFYDVYLLGQSEAKSAESRKGIPSGQSEAKPAESRKGITFSISCKYRS